MKVIIGNYAGYCFGVKRAINIVNDTLKEKKDKKIYTLGDIIHNPGVVRDLEKKGIYSVKNKDKIEEGIVLIIRSHGISPKILKDISKRDIEIIDATCPFVKKAQSKAKKLSNEGYFVVVIGDKEHPEVKGIKEQVNDKNIAVIGNVEEIKNIKDKRKIGIVIQTTQNIEKLKDISSKLMEIGDEIKILNTICNTTKQRQNATRSLAVKVDVMIIVGGKNSANTTHLAEISKEINKDTYHIESYKDLNKSWFENANIVGISGGASTPAEDIDNVKKQVENF